MVPSRADGSPSSGFSVVIHGVVTATIQYPKQMKSNTYILSIETATNLCTVSLANHGETLFSIVGEEPNLHATKLTVFVQEVVERAGLTFADLSAIAVSKGPGSYTGLRIGVSTAKGLCYALDIPLIANNSLEALVAGYMEKFGADLDGEVLLCPMIDARRREVYTALFDAQGRELSETHALIVDETTFNSYLEQGKQLILFGSGADKFAETFAHIPAITVVPAFDSLASHQDRMAYAKFQAAAFEDVAYFEPFYLKDFVATTPKKSPLL